MGQRHQFFLRVKNPLKLNIFSRDDNKRAKEIFGKNKYTILGFHHQWLYGRSAAVNIINMLNYTDKDIMSEYHNPFGEQFHAYDTSLDYYIKKLVAMVSLQTSPLHPRGIGYENVCFLNLEEDWVLTEFDSGDNNDGITIIDTITRKYCMMNIYEQDLDEWKIYTLPEMKPVSAMDYMKAYYPETVETFRDDDLSEEKILECIEENIKDNLEIDTEIKRISRGVLTEKQISKIFPKYYKKSVV